MSIEHLNSILRERLEQVHWSFYLCSRSLSELQLLTPENYSKNELKIVNSPTFNFYKITLQYCFIMEYCKLLETKEKAKNRKNNHISSIQYLNKLFYKELGNTFKPTYKENNRNIELLQISFFQEEIRVLRDKKFAHSDADLINAPYKFNGFTEDEIREGFKHLAIIKNVINNLTAPYDFQYFPELKFPYPNNQTKNFIEFQTVYKEYYFKNHLKCDTI